jgi:hypothetical protein
MLCSAFTFLHNGVAGGYPFVEAIKMVKIFADEVVVVDMQSTDQTRQVLDKLNVKVIDGQWMPGKAGACLAAAHALHTQCEHDVIWHFEADEVYSGDLAKNVAHAIQHDGMSQIAVWRLQVEQNFQRIRWYPELCHRIFYKGTVEKSGHTTLQHQKGLLDIEVIPPECGYLWDVTNCFRDDWITRLKQQAELWGELPQYRYVPYHFTQAPVDLAEGQQYLLLDQPQWTWGRSPLDLPPVLRGMVGTTSYREHLERRLLL